MKWTLKIGYTLNFQANSIVNCDSTFLQIKCQRVHEAEVTEDYNDNKTGYDDDVLGNGNGFDDEDNSNKVTFTSETDSARATFNVNLSHNWCVSPLSPTSRKKNERQRE